MVLGLGQRVVKSFTILALERAEGVATVLLITYSCTWSDLWGVGAGSLSA